MRVKFAIVLISFALLSWVPVVQAQEIELSSVPEISPTKAPVEYQLPYPGVLPGHFLYTLKDMRDTMMWFMISNPIRKAQFAILQSDKRFGAAFHLLEKDPSKIDETKKLMIKAQDYFKEALDKTEVAKKQGMDINDVMRVLTVSQEKHMEVLQSIIVKAGPDGKKHFEEHIKREEEFAKRVKQLTP